MPQYNPYKTGQEYYDNNGQQPNEKNHGENQYISLKELVDNFILMNTGEGEILSRVKPFKVLFYAKRAIQELNYDAAKELRVIQRDIGPDLKFPFPQDYVNWVRVSWFKDGVLYKLGENADINFAKEYVQDNNFQLVFAQTGEPTYLEKSRLDQARLDDNLFSQYLNPSSQFHGSNGFFIDGMWHFTPQFGGRYGLNTETANANPTFRVNRRGGTLELDSRMSGESCVLEYISDGLEYRYENINGAPTAFRNDEAVRIHKFFESYVYAYIEYELLSSRTGIQEYIVNRSRRKMHSLLRNARIRVNINPGELLMKMRGQHNHLK